MIRGSIDYVDQQRVAGWIYSDAVNLSGRTILAFLEKDCVGAGALDVFRQDLADAGLGDGIVGFGFGMHIAEEDIGRITVRLEGSDFCLMQNEARIAADTSFIDALKAKKRYTGAGISWMQQRGWIDGDDLEFLTLVTDIGVYERPLQARGQTLAAAEEARRLLETFARGPVDIAIETMTLGELAERRLPLMADIALPIVAVHGQAGALAVLEGSNGDEDFLHNKPMVGAVQHRCGADRLLFLDLRTQVQGVGGESVTVYLPR